MGEEGLAFYNERGVSGPGGLAAARWVLLRGMAREAGHWGSFADVWRAALPGTTVACPDLPGCGLAAQAACPDTVPALLDGVRAQLGLGGPRPPDARPLALFGLS